MPHIYPKVLLYLLTFFLCTIHSLVSGQDVTWNKKAAIEQYARAVGTFRELMNREPINSELAKVSPPRVDQVAPASQWAILGDYEKYLDAWIFESTDLTVLLGLCSQTHSIAVSYLLHDAKSTVDPLSTLQVQQQKTVALMNANAITFQKEFAVLQPFVIRCLATQIPLIVQFIKALPPEQLTSVRHDGLKQMTGGATTLVMGAITSVAEPQMGDDFKVRTLKALEKSIGEFSAASTLPNRLKILQFIAQRRSTIPLQYSAQIALIEAALADQTCRDLCLLQ